MGRPDKFSSIKPFIDNYREDVDMIPPIIKKPLEFVEEMVEMVSSAPAKSGVTNVLSLVDTTPERVEELRLQQENNAKALARYQKEIQEINKIIPQRRAGPLNLLYEDIRRNTNFNPLTLGDHFDNFRGLMFNETAAIHRKVANGQVRASDLQGRDLINYYVGIIDTFDIATLGAFGLVTMPLRLGIRAFEKGYVKLANQFLKEAGDDTLKNVSNDVVSGLDKGKMVDQYGVALQKDDGTGGGSSNQLIGTQNPETREKIQKTIKDQQLAKIVKLDEQLGLNPPDGKINVTPMARMIGPGFRTGPIEEYAKNNPNSNIAKYLIKQVKRADQLTDEVLDLLKFEFDETGEKINMLAASELTGIPKTTLYRLLEDDTKGISQFISPKEIKGRAGTFFESYFPPANKSSTLEAKVQDLVIRDMYRSNAFGDEKEFLRIMEDAGIIPNKIRTMEDGKAVYTRNPNYDSAAMKKRRELLFVYIRDNYFEPGDYQKLLDKVSHRDQLTNHTVAKFKETVLNNEGFRKQFVEEYNKVYPDNTYGDDIAKMAEDYATQHFTGHMAHIMPIGKTKKKTPVKGEMFKTAEGLEGMFFYPEFYSVNFAAHNIGLQNRFENTITRVIANLKKGKDVEKNIENLVKIDQQMNEKGIRTYLRFTEKQLPKDVQELLANKFTDRVSTEPNQPGINSIFFGRLDDPTLAENINYFDGKMDEYVNNPSSFKISQQVPKEGLSDEMFISGSAPYIMLGQPLNFEQGGDVETEQEKQSFISKAASTISDILIPKAEALPLPKNFLVGDVPKINKKTEVKLELPAPEAPLMEKRYNIFDENGQKVYQSKSIDDAQQKALRLEDLEGKTFTVKEVEVPIKVKKSKTTKPGTALVPTVTPDTIIGSGNSKLFYSDLKGIVNPDSGNLTIRGKVLPADIVSMSAKDWHDWFRSSGIKEGELYDSYVRAYLNKKGGFNRETGKFTNDQKISYAEIKELVDTSPTNYIQSVSYSDAAGNLKYGNTGRQDGAINGSRVERVLWLDSKDIRGDIGSLPEEIRRYEGHSSMRNVQSSNDFSVQNNTLNGEPYVIGWSLNSNRIGQLNNKPIIVNVADEIQSDFLQKAASLKSKIKKEIRDLVQGTNILPGGSDELNALYKRLENVFRPMPATYAQLKKSIDELLEADAIFQKIGDMEMDDITKASFKELGEAAKKRDKALATINATIDDIDTRELFPNIPFKDQKDWVDAIIKNDLYHAAKARFSFDESGKLVVNQDAPAYYAVAPAKAVKAYRGGRGVELTPDNPDRSGTMVAYDMQYGGPNLNDHTGQHFTSNVEESLNKIANMKNSKVEVGQVNFGFAGEGVDTFMIELTPDMLMPYKAYKKDGGLVKKSILYTPIVSIDKLLSPIGASRW